MKRENINYFYVGLFTLSMMILLIITLLRITGRGSNVDYYYTIYDNVSGIREGTTVTYGGYQVGKLIHIEPQRNKGKTFYKLKLGIQSGWPVPIDSYVRMVSPGLLAESQIDISEGDSTEILKPNTVLASRAALDMMSVLSSMGGEFSNLSESGIIPLLKNINKQVDGFGNNIPGIVGDSKELITSLNAISNRMEKFFTDENSTHLNSVITNADQMTGNLASLSEKLNTITTELQSLVASSNKILQDNDEDIRRSILDLRKTLDVTAQNMETIMYNLDVSSRNVSEFSHQIRSNPAILLNGKPVKDEGK